MSVFLTFLDKEPPRKEYLEMPLPLPPSLYGRSLARSLARSCADVITKFSRLDGLPIFLTRGAKAPL